MGHHSNIRGPRRLRNLLRFRNADRELRAVFQSALFQCPCFLPYCDLFAYLEQSLSIDGGLAPPAALSTLNPGLHHRLHAALELHPSDRIGASYDIECRLRGFERHTPGPFPRSQSAAARPRSSRTAETYPQFGNIFFIESGA